VILIATVLAVVIVSVAVIALVVVVALVAATLVVLDANRSHYDTLIIYWK
jgi:hypothetical protein